MKAPLTPQVKPSLPAQAIRPPKPALPVQTVPLAKPAAMPQQPKVALPQQAQTPAPQIKPAPAGKPAAQLPTSTETPVPKLKPDVRMSLAESGVTAKVYAAYYGRWRRVTDAYMDVYAGTAKAPNTGRVSECTAQLLAAGLLEVQKQKERWPLYRASMQWLYEEFSAKNAALSEADKAALAKVLLPPEDAYRKAEVPWFGLTPAEIAGKRPFSPTPQKIRDFLHASVAYALFLLGNPTAALPKQSVESALERIKKNMGMPSAGFGRGDSQKPMPAVSSAAPLQADAGLAQGQYAHPFTAARAPASTPLYKLVRMPCGERAAAGFLGTSRNPRARNGF